MVNNPDIHLTPARRVLPGWDYWALTLLGAPVAASAFCWLLSALAPGLGAGVLLAICAAIGALAGLCAPSCLRLAPGLRAFWAGAAALITTAVPVVIVLTAFYIACSGGGCFS